MSAHSLTAWASFGSHSRSWHHRQQHEPRAKLQTRADIWKSALNKGLTLKCISVQQRRMAEVAGMGQ